VQATQRNKEFEITVPLSESIRSSNFHDQTEHIVERVNALDDGIAAGEVDDDGIKSLSKNIGEDIADIITLGKEKKQLSLYPTDVENLANHLTYIERELDDETSVKLLEATKVAHSFLNREDKKTLAEAVNDRWTKIHQETKQKPPASLTQLKNRLWAEAMEEINANMRRSRREENPVNRQWPW
jgi:hypothetical protein